MAVYRPTMGSGRLALVHSALRLSYFTVAWNGVVGVAALVAAVTSGSTALIAFALSALLDSSASAVLIWRFREERRDSEAAERLERHAQTWIVVAMLATAAYVGAQASRALIAGDHPGASILGATLAVASLLVLPWLARRKLRVAAGLESQALRGDGILTAAAAALAAITLAALIVNSALAWWWADPCAALLIAVALASEAIRIAVRHRFG
jgi:divalent metal cation (Fe/Co/Zn/Cd) transporter